MASWLWTQRQDIGPPARLGHALAYDETNQRTLLVGGEGVGGVVLGDTWLWDGEYWTQVEDIGPSGRTDHAIAYDSARGRVVLFGGLSSPGGVLRDTWAWDGAAWTQLEDTGPSPRVGHALAFDSARSRVVLFGGAGADGVALGDTWEWDGDEWTQVADTGPSARRGHAMCFDTTAGRTTFFGGSTESDTWAWNGTTWTALNDVGPPPCLRPSLVFAEQSAVLFGGLATEAPVGLTWEFNGVDWTERQDIGPAPRFAHAMSYDRTRKRVVIFGGHGAPAGEETAASVLSDTWELPRENSGSGGGGPGTPALLEAYRLTSFSVEPGGPAVDAAIRTVLEEAGVVAVSNNGWVTIRVALNRPLASDDPVVPVRIWLDGLSVVQTLSISAPNQGAAADAVSGTAFGPDGHELVARIDGSPGDDDDELSTSIWVG